VKHDVVIVGAGLSGLCCARKLHQAGRRFLLLDAADAVGGRIRTDIVDGFWLDRGFQVFLTAYPEAQQVLDYEALDLRRFEPGAMVRYRNRFHQLSDPWRRPIQGFRSLFSPIGSLTDKLKIAKLRSSVIKGNLDELFGRPEITTQQALQQIGFSESIIERFFRPFLGGIFLDADTATSSRMFHFVFRMFSIGHACLPSEGMETIPRQIASTIPNESLRLNTKVSHIQKGMVVLDDGESIETQSIVVATQSSAAAELLGESITPRSQGVTCLYYAVDRSPINEPILVLNGEGKGPINNLCVPSLLAPYAPDGQHLISVTVLDDSIHDDELLEASVRQQLVDWFGSKANDWRHLRTYRIPHALPSQLPPTLSPPQRSVRIRSGLYVCGDHRDNASIQGAMVSGRRAAESLLEELG